MANALYGNAWVCDTVGIISKSPVRIKAIEIDPSAAGGLCLFNWWDEANPIASTKLFIPSATITGTNTFTDNNASANVLSNIFADGAVLKIFGHGENGGSGAAANHTYHLIVTAGNNDVVVTDVTLTNEAAKSYKIEAYPARTAISVTTPGTETVNEFRYFGERGIRFPNLTLETITNVTKAIIYLADE